ncbi:MAG: class I SAM-dependent methyltransferase [Bryobacteraceae bacterium]
MTRVVSFRDPGGFLSLADDRVIRTVHPEGFENLEVCLHSATVRRYAESRSVVSTRIVDGDPAARQLPIVVEHERIPFPSYAHEWPAEMLLAAGDLTLSLAEDLLSEGLGLKDATPHNVLFEGPRAVFVDVLSFERRDACDPIWLADAQFTRSFLIPLVLYQRLGLPLQRTFLSRRDGMTPLDARRVIPWPQRWLPPYLEWITLPARACRLERPSLYRPRPMRDAEQARYVLRHRFRRIRKQLRGLAPEAASSPWLDYESARPSYSAEQHAAKNRFVAEALDAMSPRKLLDVGANAGEYSLMAAQAGASVVAIDSDPAPVGALWQKAKGRGADILSLVVDFARPTPALGWRCAEQASFLDRATGFFDSVAMLAVLHHLLVTDQIPLVEIFDAAAELTSRWLLVEYVGPSDTMFQRLLRGRGELYRWLNRTAFEEHASRRFETVFSRQIPGADRCLYLLRKRA